MAAHLNLGNWRLLTCQPGKWKPLRHFTVKPACLARITFQFSYINWDVLGTLGCLPVSNALTQTEAHPKKSTPHNAVTSFSLSAGGEEDILFVKLINIPSFRQLFLYTLYHIPRCHGEARARAPTHTWLQAQQQI